MKRTPIWLKFCRGFLVFGAFIFIMVLVNGEAKADDAPTALLIFSLCHLSFRAPYSPWRWWDWFTLPLSLSFMALGSWGFSAEDPEMELGLQIFMTVLTCLALGYGYFCTAVPTEHPLRNAVIEPTKKVAHFGIIGCDFGLVAAPFAFVFYVVRHFVGTRHNG